MSGICGIYEPGRTVDAASLERMLDALALKGESGRDRVCESSIALGVAQRWPFQQVASIPGILVAVDAELFNQDELTKSFLGGGKPLLSIAQLVAALYLEKGTEFVTRLDGVFSIALWDQRAHRLVLAIDRLGVNSLYWRQDSTGLQFASRVGGIRTLLDHSAEIDPRSLMQYLLFSAVPAPLSIYKGVEKLAPGRVLIYENGKVRQQQYWDMEFNEDESRDEQYWAGEVRETMRTATHLHLRDSPPEQTGAYLSGGTDSSSVVAFMAERHARVNSFSIFFSEDKYSEVNYARIAAQRFGTRHHELCLNPQDALEAIPLLSQYFDEPFANSSAIGGYFCAHLARQNGISTLLAGDGGDELFAGNERYASDRKFAIYQDLPAALRRWMIEPAVRLLPESEGKLGLPRRYVRRANIPNPGRIFSYGLFLSSRPEDIFEADFLRSAPPANWMNIADGHFHSCDSRSELNRILYLDIKMTLADNDLRKVLGTAEIAGVRARFPLLDHRLVELSGRIPSHLKLKGFKKRYIFKQAMKETLPAEILNKQKHGFGVPVALWFLQDPRLDSLMKDILNDSRTRQRGYFRPAFIDEVMRRHRHEDAKNYGEILWYLVVLEMWHRQHLEATTASTYVR